MVAGYSRKYKTYNERETGIATGSYLPNKVSVITDRPKAGMIEKYHALTYSPKANFSIERGKYMRQENEKHLKKLKKFKVSKFAGRRFDDLFLAWARTGVINGYVEVGVDKAHLWQLRQYAASVDQGGVRETPTCSVWKHHSDLAKNAIDLAKNSTFMNNRPVKKLENHCKHFKDGNG